MMRDVEGGDEQQSSSFQRLLMGCRFPDGSFALASLVDRTRNIEIAGLSDERAQSMPGKYVMNVKIDSDQ